ncbi:MAG: tripartite tricarboxylate transporter substrate binding protein [Pigmentiphaga sp.]|uniref:Bug family tripartite tricarboxylate transporter substrate binding protein n=1 Tax=Pigmentiphaga sp. TaxID=1977564 RepID=UPI0029AACFFB|nr:tripartite tricarboxylate transporter substrate binding protein [Pigmentiphaga sp.]MDX3907004.1 tripartite tricarboxylate transporter substrate binding protein [Pigmentiphaga sp.]
MKRYGFIALLCCVFAPLGHAQAPSAADFPARPVTVVIGYPAGAGTDVLGRVIAGRLASRLGKPFVVENQPGASGMIGAGHVARAQPDGYTLLVAPNTLFIAARLLPKATMPDVVKDYAPIIQLSQGSLILAARPSLNVKDVRGLVAQAREGRALTYGSPGSGSPMHIAGELFNREAGVRLTHVPYRGTAPAITDMLGGHIDLIYGVPGSLWPHVAAGKMVPLGLAQTNRSPLLPDVPTLAEQGVAGIDVQTWYGVFAPAGTPPAIVEKLNREINAILAEPRVRDEFRSQWEIPVGGSAQAFAERTRADYEQAGRWIATLNIKLD